MFTPPLRPAPPSPFTPAPPLLLCRPDRRRADHRLPPRLRPAATAATATAATAATAVAAGAVTAAPYSAATESASAHAIAEAEAAARLGATTSAGVVRERGALHSLTVHGNQLSHTTCALWRTRCVAPDARAARSSASD